MTDTIWAWSQTAADNDDSDAASPWPEGTMEPSQVNNSARAIMARVAQLISDLAPTRTSTNSGNDYTVSSDAAGATLRNGETISFIVNAANTSACRLNVDGRGFVPWRPKAATEFNAGDLIAGQPVTAFYRSATNEWLSTGTAYQVSSTALGITLQSIAGRVATIGQPELSLDATVRPGRIRLTETTQAVLKSDWPELNSWLSARSYPWGSSPTHFNLPPAAGYVLRFAGTSSSIDTSGARLAGSVQTDQNRSATAPLSGITAATSTSVTTSTTTGVTTSTTTNTTVATTISPNPHSHVSGGTAFLGASGSAVPVPNGTANTGAVSLTATSTATSTSDSVSSAVSTSTSSATSTTTVSGGSAAVPGGDEVRVKNVAMHVEVVASTALMDEIIGSFGFAYQWDIGTTAANPGAGRVRGNNATLGSITQIYVSSTDRWGVDLAGFFSSLTVGSKLSLSRIGAQGNRVVALMSGAPVNNSGWFTLPVSALSVGGALASNSSLALEVVGSAGATGASGSSGFYSFDYAFDTGTADADPGNGRVRANNATLPATSFLYISESDRFGVAQAAGIQAWDDANHPTNKGWLTLIETGNPANRSRFQITGAITDAGTYDKIPVAHVSGVTSLTNSANVAVLFEPGPALQGPAGAGGINPNLLINGDFQINQRAFAGGALAAGVYGFDRWRAATGGANLTLSGYVVTLASGAIEQVIEVAHWGVASLASTQVTVSVEAPSADLTVTLGSVSGTITAGGGQRSVALTLSAGDTGNLVLRVQRASAGSVTFGRVKAEVGSATAWQARSQTEELALCQRYYWRRSRLGDYDIIFMVSYYTTTACWGGAAYFPVTMRAAPTMTFSAAGDFQTYVTAELDVSSITGLRADRHAFWVSSTIATAAAPFVGAAAMFYFKNAAIGWIAASAEL